MLAALLDLVLPTSCVGCAAPGRDLCSTCLDRVRGPVLGRHRPTPCPPGLPPLSAAAMYEGVVRDALVAHKEQGRLRLVSVLGALLASAVAALPLPPDVLLVPVPSAPATVRARGQDHALRLARTAAAALTAAGTRARVAPVLVPARRMHDQAGLGSAERARNVAGALRLRSPVPRGPAVVLVDDVVTTGVTLAEAARAVRAGGGTVSGASVVAATRRRGDPLPWHSRRSGSSVLSGRLSGRPPAPPAAQEKEEPDEDSAYARGSAGSSLF